MKTAIVTGGTGFIGGWLIQELLNNDYYVSVIVRNRGRLLNEFEKNDHISIVEKEIAELSESDFVFDQYDAFFHLGWAGVSSDKKNDIETQLMNIKIGLDAINICSKLKCKKFLATGTVAEYVFSPDVMDVNARQTPNDIYGAAKVAAHYFLEVRARQLEQPFIWLIIPSTFGERRNDSNIITYTIKSLLKKEIPQYGNLEQMWDFLYVAEVVRAIRLIGEMGISGKVYGIGSGEYHPLKEYIIKIRDIIDPSLKLGIGEIPAMSKKSFSSCVNIDELKADTGFEPLVSFEEGIRRTIKYQKEKLGFDE